jgi:serine/threonine-protein kinase
MEVRDLFVSYSSEDADVARDLRRVLEDGGFSCWMAPDDITGTGTWAEQILDAIESSRALIVLVSGNANASPHVSREVNLALGRKRPILPIRIENVAPDGALEYLLSLVQRVDAFPPPIQSHGSVILKRLASVLRSGETEVVAEKPSSASPVDAQMEASAGDEAPAKDKAAPKRRATRGKRPALSPAGIGPGSVIDDFTIETLLGEGGMGTVYRARQAEPNRAVALKVLRPDHASDEAYRRRFLSEKDTLASLEHPSIVPIYAAGEDQGVLYIAMRLVAGSDLGARIAAAGHLSLRETVRILRPIADAIDYAHGAGVIHRDLKPANIILDRDERAYLTDFGLGKRLEATSQLTEQGVTIGTLEYMAPEQFTGRLDPATAERVDLYALGCVAYVCLAGTPPFVRSSPAELMHAHTSEPAPSIQTIRPEIPKAVDEVLAKALAKDPTERYGSATEFVGALEGAFMSPAMGQTVTFKKPITDPRTRVTTWLRANTSTAVILGSLGAIALVVMVAAAGGGGGPDPTSTPGATPGPTSGATNVVADHEGPTGGDVSIVSDEPGLERTVTTKPDVTIEVLVDPVDPSGVTSYVASNTPTRPISGAQPFVDEFSWSLFDGESAAGEKTIYVWFADALGNWTVDPLEASIKFDNPPVIQPTVTWYLSDCGQVYAGLQVMTDTKPLATDLEGLPTLVHFWAGAPAYPGTQDLSSWIDDPPISISPNLTKFTQNQTVTDYFSVQDSDGVRRAGSITFAISGCPT